MAFKRPFYGYSSSNKPQLKPLGNQQLETMKKFMRENLNPGSTSMPAENTIIHALPDLNPQDTTPETICTIIRNYSKLFHHFLELKESQKRPYCYSWIEIPYLSQYLWIRFPKGLFIKISSPRGT